MPDNKETLLVEPTIIYTPNIIKVIGVGGGGGNAVGQMYKEGIEGVRFLVANTDQKALEDSIVPDKLQMGPGLGAGGRPEIGRKYAEESLKAINAELSDDVKMVFITAGMGGGTGTGASPIIAREAKKRGILTVGVVTLPFLFEMPKQIDKALDGLEALSDEVDAMLVINNQRLYDIYAEQSVLNAFKKADMVLSTAVRSIVEIINMRGKILLDFRDINNVLKDGGVAVISTGYGRGEGRLSRALDDAIYSPLLNNNDVYHSQKIVVRITCSSKTEHLLRMEEFGELNTFMERFRPDIFTKYGLDFDDSLDDQLKVTVLASGFRLAGKDKKNQEVEEIPQMELDEKANRRLLNYPELSRDKKGRTIKRRPKSYIFSLEDLDNEEILNKIESVPTAKRTSADLASLCTASSTIDMSEPQTTQDAIIFGQE